MTADLLFEEGVQVWYPEGNFYWVDASIFRIDEAARSQTPVDLLRALLLDEHYVSVYHTADDRPAARATAILAKAGGDRTVRPAALTGYYRANARASGQEPTDTHGPYFLSFIRAESFEQISADAGRARLVEWLEDDGQFPLPPPGRLDNGLERILETTASADTIFWLTELSEDAHHIDWSLTDPFIELVAIDLARGTVTLVAAGGD